MKRRGSSNSHVGRLAVDFRLEDHQGRTHRLADYRGRWLLLVFHRHLG